MENLIFKVNSYGNYSSGNYGAHCLMVTIANKDYFFSYNTLIAFRGYNSKNVYYNVCIENYWSNTTGKHLNWIQPNKSKRVKREKFNELLEEFLK